MKKALLLLICLNILTLTGCNQALNSLSVVSYTEVYDEQPSDITATASTSEQSNTDNSSEAPVSSQGTVSDTSSKACQHTYTETFKDATCTTDGSILYQCTKCGYSYSKALKGGHDFSKYLCERCGVIDKSMNVYTAVSAWLSKYGTLSDNGYFYCYPNQNTEVHISASAFSDTADLSVTCGNEKSLHFEVTFGDDELCRVYFAKGDTYGRYEIKKSAFSGERKIVFEKFNTPQSNPIDQDAFATDCAKLIDSYMKRLENEILIPKMGITLVDIGFSCYGM